MTAAERQAAREQNRRADLREAIRLASENSPLGIIERAVGISGLLDALDEKDKRIAELEADKARLDFMILQSDMGNGWLDDGVWDNTPAGLPDVDTRDLIRMVIDAAMKESR